MYDHEEYGYAPPPSGAPYAHPYAAYTAGPHGPPPPTGPPAYAAPVYDRPQLDLLAEYRARNLLPYAVVPLNPFEMAGAPGGHYGGGGRGGGRVAIGAAIGIVLALWAVTAWGSSK